jgi:tetraacyldisaccharide 4'-kinase
VIEARSFADHHRYSAAEARDLLAAANNRDLMLVTTEKDRARMQGDAALKELAAAARALPVKLQFDDEGSLRSLLERALRKARG